MKRLIRVLSAISVSALLSVVPASRVHAQPEEILKSRSAEANVVFGRIVRVDGHRLDVTDGKASRSLILAPETIVEIDGKAATLEDLPPQARIRWLTDANRPDTVTRIIVVPGEPSEAAVPPRLMPRETTTPPLPNAVETLEERATNDQQSGLTPIVKDAVPPVPIGAVLETTPQGVQVVSVDPEGVFSRSGIRVGDYLKRVGDKNVVTADGVARAFHQSPAGTEFVISFVRAGEDQTAAVLLPNTFSPALLNSNPSTVSVRKIDRAGWAARQIGWELGMSGSVPKIVAILPESPAFVAGLHVGDEIIDLNGRRVASAADLMNGIESQSGIPQVDLTVRRGNESLHRTVVLPADTVTRDDVLLGSDLEIRQRLVEQGRMIEDLQNRLSTLEANFAALRVPAVQPAVTPRKDVEVTPGAPTIPPVPPVPVIPPAIPQ
ncbi:PDZ domain-containing protein [Planctomicrobium sp. SH661]|uniref:PDZ domain-containing protein n=1 Tax=Planctomicrobium sp. SH661 TaxID=3448124 RepID=UPI003F5BC1E2